MAISSAGLIGAAVGVSLGSTIFGAALAAFFIVLAFKRLMAQQPIEPTTDEVMAEALFNNKPIRPLQYALNKPFAVARGICTAVDNSLASAGGMSYFISNWVLTYLECREDELPDMDFTILTSTTGFDCDWRAFLTKSHHPYKYGLYTLRMIVARFLTARMTIDGDPATTFLPPALLEVYQEIMAERKKEMPMMFLGHKVPWDLPYVWRVLSIHILLRNRYSCHQHTGYWAPSEVKADDPRMPKVNAAAEELWSVLKPFRRVRRRTPSDEPPTEEEALARLKWLFLRMTMIATSYLAMINPVEMYWVDDMPEGALFQVFPGIRELQKGEYQGRPGMHEFIKPVIMQHPEFAVTNGRYATHRDEVTPI